MRTHEHKQSMAQQGGRVARRGRRALIARDGLTLLEVLIAIFVLAIGLLGVAALIPVGRFQLEQGAKQDRAGAVGRAAWREVEVRGMLDPNVWINWEGAVFARGITTWPNGSTRTTPFAWVDVDEPTDLGAPMPLVDFMPGAASPSWGMTAWGSLVPTPPLAYRPLGPLGRGNSICIDPYFLASNQEPAGNSYIRTFPYVLNSDPDMDAFSQPIGNDDWPNPPRMERISLNLDPNRPLSELPGGPPPVAPPYYGRDTHLTMAQRLFAWHDDLSFGQASNPDQRPIWSVSRDAGGQIVEHTAAGEYSWLVTVTPAVQQTKPQSGVQMDYSVSPPVVAPLPGGIVGEHASASAQKLYTVSVVVFHRRDASFVTKHAVPRQGEWLVGPPSQHAPGSRAAPPERMVYCDFLGTGRGGGDVRLRLQPSLILFAQRNLRRPERSDFPPVVVGQWIMVCGWRQSDLVIGSGTPPTDVSTAIGGVWDPLNPAFPPNRQAVFRWYRVAAVSPLTAFDIPPGDNLADEWYQDVTLVGPDWDPNQFLDADSPTSTTAHGSYIYAPATSSRTCYAALIKGVVAVYEKTIALDEF